MIDSKEYGALQAAVQHCFSSAACLNGSFLKPDHYDTSQAYHGLDLLSIREAYRKLMGLVCIVVV